MFNCCMDAGEQLDKQQEVVSNQVGNAKMGNSPRDEDSPRTNASKRRPSVKSSGQGRQEIHEVHENSAEHLEWLNMSLKHLWPELSEAASAVAYSKILPILRQKLVAKGKGKITDVDFASFSLGSVPVVLGPVQVSRMPKGSVRIRMKLDYTSDMRVEVSLDSTLGKWTFGMKDFRILGQLVLRVRPHIPDSPGTGGVSVFFVDPPKVDFKFSGDMQFGNFPFIKEIMRQLVDGIVADMFVLPNVATQHMSLHDMKMYPLVIASPVPVGILRVTLQETSLEDKAIQLAEEDQQPKKKKGAGFFSRLLGIGGKAVQALSDGMENAEEWVERQVGQAMGIETAPYMRWKIGNQIWLPDFHATGAETFNFVIYDPEQHLSITLWDRDLLSQDDLMGEAQSVAAVKAVYLSESSVPLISPGDNSGETRQAGSFKAKIELLITAPGHQSQQGFICVVRVRELLQEGSKMKGRRLAVRAKLMEEANMTKAGAAMADITETLQAKAMLQKIKENMSGAGIEEQKIDEVLDLTSLRISRFAINRSLHFVIKNEDTQKEDLILQLVDMDKVDELKKEAAKKKKVFGGTSPISPASTVIPEDGRGDEVLASLTVRLSEVRDAPGLALAGPFFFESEELGKIEAKMAVGLSGLEPTTTEVMQGMMVDDVMASVDLSAV